MSENEMILLLQKRRDILTKVKDFRNNVNPSKVNFLDPSRDDIWQVNLISKVLAEFSIDEEDYENALKFSDEKGLRLHLECSADSCIVECS